LTFKNEITALVYAGAFLVFFQPGLGFGFQRSGHNHNIWGALLQLEELRLPKGVVIVEELEVLGVVFAFEEGDGFGRVVKEDVLAWVERGKIGGEFSCPRIVIGVGHPRVEERLMDLEEDEKGET
jgi:hypothetical protein